MKEICIKKLYINHPLKGELSFHCHLLIEKTHCNHTITLKMYSDNYSRLIWIGDFLGKNEIPDLISINQEYIDDDKIIAIKLPSEKTSGVTESSSFYENGSQYILVTFREVFIEYKLNPAESKLQRVDSYFHLSENAVHLFADDYFYSLHNVGNWKAVNRKNKLNKFLEFHYKFLILFPTKKAFHSGSNELVISRNPAIKIRYQKGTISKDLSTLFTKILSFYLSENIDYHFGFIYYKKSKVEHYKNIKNNQFRNNPVLCRHADFDDIYDFIKNIKNKRMLLSQINVIKKYIDKFVLASLMTSESKFIIYFSIFEGVRNNVNKNMGIKIKENFTFIRKPNNELKKTLLKLASIVEDKDKELYENSVDWKIANIKRYPVKEQFSRFLRHMKIDLSNYNLNLNQVLSLRNKIFHGSFVKDEKVLNEINPNLERLASKMIRILMNCSDNHDKKIESKIK